MAEWLLNDDACAFGQACSPELLYDISEKGGWNRQIVRWVEDLSKGNLQPRKGNGVLVITVDIAQSRQELVETTLVIDTTGCVFDTVASAVAQLLEIPT